MKLFDNDVSSFDRDNDSFNNNDFVVRELIWNDDVSSDIVKKLDEENGYLPLIPGDKFDDYFDFLVEHKKSNIYLNDAVFSKMR